MDREFFEFDHLPFEDRADAKFYFASPDAAEALASMEYAALHGKRVALVVGEAGTGKTLLVRMLLGRLSDSQHGVALSMTPHTNVDLVREVAKRFGVTVSSSPGGRRALAKLGSTLRKQTKSGQKPILIIDRAENLTRDNMPELLALIGLEYKSEPMLRIIMLGQPRVDAILKHDKTGTLRQQVFGGRRLRELTKEQTAEYIRHRVSVAGGAENLFDDRAIELIFEQSEGNCRKINRFCRESLIVAASAKQAVIGSDIVRRALGLEAEAPEVAVAPAAVSDSAAIEQSDTIATPAVQEIETPQTIQSSLAAESASEQAPAPKRSDSISVRGSAVPPAMSVGEPQTLPERTIATHNSIDSAIGRGKAFLKRQELANKNMESLTNAGEEMIERFEQLLRRADRMRSSHEMGLDRYSAIEEHLSTLSGGAEHLTESLESSVDSAQRRFDTLFSQMEERFSRIEERVNQLSESASSAEKQVVRLEHATENADEVEGRLGGFAGQLTSKMERAQKGVEQLMKSLDAGEEVYEKLQSLVHQVLTTVSETDAKIGVQRKDLQNLAAEAHSVRTEVTDSAIENYKLQLRKAVEQWQQAQILSAETTMEARSAEMQRFKIEVSARLRQWAECQRAQEGFESRVRRDLEQAESRYSSISEASEQVNRDIAKVEENIEKVGNSIETLNQQVVEAPQELKEVVEACRVAREETATTTNRAVSIRESLGETTRKSETILANVQSHRDEIEAAQQRVVEAKAAMDEVSERAAGQIAEAMSLIDQIEQKRAELNSTAESTTASFNDVVQRSQAQMAEISASADRSRNELLSAKDECEGMLSRVQGTRGELDSMHHNIAGQLVEIGVVCERMNTLQEKIPSCEKIADRLTSASEDGRQVAENLSRSLEETGQLSETINVMVNQAESKISQLSSHHSAAGNLLGQLSEANKEGQSILSEIDECALRTKEYSVDLGRQAEAGARTISVLEQSIATASESAAEVRKATESASARADEAAAALNAIREDAESSIALAESKATQAQEAGIALERLTREATELTNSFEQHVRNFGELDQRAKEERNQLRDAVDGASFVSQQIRESAELAIEQAGIISEQCASAREHAARIDDFATMLESASKATKTLDIAIESAREMADHHEGSVQTAEELRNATAAAEGLLDSVGGLIVRAQSQEQSIRKAIEMADDTAKKSEELRLQTDRAEQANCKLGGTVDNAISMVEQLDAAYELAAALETAGEEATRIKGELLQASEQAGQQSGVIAEHCRSASSLVTKLEGISRLLRIAKNTEGGLQGSIEDARGLVSRFKESEEIIERFTEAAKDADSLTEQLDKSVRMASDQSNSINEDCRKAAKLVERLNGVSRLLRLAKNVDEKLSATVTSATGSAEKLDGLVNTAREHLGGLEAADNESNRIIAEQGELVKESRVLFEQLLAGRDETENLLGNLNELRARSESARESLGAQLIDLTRILQQGDVLNESLSERAGAIEAGERMIGELIDTAKELSKQLRAIDAKTNQLDDTIAELLQKPEEVVAGAKAQAVQLDTVCNAVRKVFAGLSKATLDSQKTKEEIARVSDASLAKSQQVRAEIARASEESVARSRQAKAEVMRATEEAHGKLSTLSRWVEEATRTQARLAETLGQCPSIAETHPIEGTYRPSLSATSKSSKPSAPQEEKVLAGPVSVPAATIESEQPPTATKRAEEIAKILQESKRAPREAHQLVSPD